MADRSFAGQLSRESEAWVAEGLVTAEQAAAIRSRYADVREERRGSATTALAVIGALAVGLGVIGFVAANWEGMSHAVRLVLLTAAVAGSYAAAYHLRERTGRVEAGDLRLHADGDLTAVLGLTLGEGLVEALRRGRGRRRAPAGGARVLRRRVVAAVVAAARGGEHEGERDGDECDAGAWHRRIIAPVPAERRLPGT